jgi:hypothetical protein
LQKRVERKTRDGECPPKEYFIIITNCHVHLVQESIWSFRGYPNLAITPPFDPLCADFLGWYNFYPLLCKFIWYSLENIQMIFGWYLYNTHVIVGWFLVFQIENSVNFQNWTCNLAISLNWLFTMLFILYSVDWLLM